MGVGEGRSWAARQVFFLPRSFKTGQAFEGAPQAAARPAMPAIKQVLVAGWYTCAWHGSVSPVWSRDDDDEPDVSPNDLRVCVCVSSVGGISHPIFELWRGEMVRTNRTDNAPRQFQWLRYAVGSPLAVLYASMGRAKWHDVLRGEGCSTRCVSNVEEEQGDLGTRTNKRMKLIPRWPR